MGHREDAEKYRMQQATELIESLAVRFPDGRTVPAFIKRTDGSYTPNPEAEARLILDEGDRPGLPFNARDMAKQFRIVAELGITMEEFAEAQGLRVDQLEAVRTGLKELEEME
jgi:hypothetical protein